MFLQFKINIILPAAADIVESKTGKVFSSKNNAKL